MRTTGIIAALLLAISLFTPGPGWGDEWYAPKIGVVKSLVTIKQKTKAGPKSETRTYQLVSFKP